MPKRLIKLSTGKAREIGGEVMEAFTYHPEETGETYLQHLWFTVTMSVRFAYVSFIIMAHGVFPFLFMKSASREIEKIYRIMKVRIPKARLEAIEAEEHHYHGA